MAAFPPCTAPCRNKHRNARSALVADETGRASGTERFTSTTYGTSTSLPQLAHSVVAIVPFSSHSNQVLADTRLDLLLGDSRMLQGKNDIALTIKTEKAIYLAHYRASGN